ncbi:hypothetical protein BH10ACT2_BH10ACT2_23930 [soil metagenome]
MSYQMPPTGGPPRSTPIPGESTVIPGTGPAPFRGVQTPGAFLGNQNFEPPPPIKQKKDRNWGFWVMALFIVLPVIFGIGAAIWAVVQTKDAIDNANDTVDQQFPITLPQFNIPGVSSIPGVSGDTGDGTEPVSLLLDGGPAATVAALDAGIPGSPTNFIEIILYPGYSFATAQDPVKPDHLDRYGLRDGVLDAPEPQSNDADAPSKVFTIDAVDWAAVAALAAEAPRLTAVEEGEVTHIFITRDAFTDAHDVVVRVYVNGPRSSAFIEATPDGTVIRIS